jgi:hypothetical protein
MFSWELGLKNFEPHDDDVISINVDGDNKMLKVGDLPTTVTALLFDPEIEVSDSSLEGMIEALLEEGHYCEFLSAKSGGGWKKGKLRLRFEFVLDEPEPEPSSSDLVLSPNSEQQQ